MKISLLSLLLAVNVIFCQTTFAHAILVRSEPAAEAVLQTKPQRVDLWFDAGVGPKYTALAIVNTDGERMDNHDAELDLLDKSHLSATLKGLVPGRYGVRYRVQSADGHIVTGKFFFQVAE